ncbi:PREDICTED: inner centromere protein, partial [Tinamus guttatus]|uniref:inner centromere protein n=1 Tax=Tinamus guttatus TaxID=94827 RepID=UPI00052E7A4E
RRRRPPALQGQAQEPARKRISRRRKSSLKPVAFEQCSQRAPNKQNLELTLSAAEGASSSQRVTRSQSAALAKCSGAPVEKPSAQPAKGKVVLVEIGVNERLSAELLLQKRASKPGEEVSTTVLLSPGDASPQDSSAAEPQPELGASLLAAPHTPKAKDIGESSGALNFKPNTTSAANVTVIITEEPKEQEADVPAQAPEPKEDSGKQLSQSIIESPGTPTGSRVGRRSVRRSLMGRPSTIRRTSLAEKYSLGSKRQSVIRKSLGRAAAKRRTFQKSSASSGPGNCLSNGEVPGEEETAVKTGPHSGLCTPSKLDVQSPRMSLRTRTLNRDEQSQEMSNTESNLNKNGETQDPPQSARRKQSYKRAVDHRYDYQQEEDGGLSPPRRKTPSPLCPASKVVRPFKTFLHTVQKNQLLMTPSSVGRSGVIKSFIRHNTPLQTDPKEKERQKLETLRKKQEAEQLRKQKLEEEKRRRLEEAKLKREERLRKVLQARERAGQIEEERKRRIEQKIALFDEKTEKVREERLAEEKIKKKAAAKKMEEAEARRRQEEEARKQRALQQEEGERRHRELMQKKKEEEQERARKIAEQRQAEQEREKQLAAEREQERKKEQERIQAEKQREEQEKAARLKKELLAAKEQLHREVEKEQEQHRLAEVKRQEQEEKTLPEEQKAKEGAQTQHLEKKEASPVCSSYEMTPQGLKGPKPPKINPNNYGMDLNSDDSTDDESQPRKPIPAWATGDQLTQAVIRQYYNPPDVDALFGIITNPKLEDIFNKSKPRYFKRTSSAVWNSPPLAGAKSVLGLPYGLKK